MKSEGTKKIAAIYCRVSTHEQGKGDFSSLDSQEALLRKYCADKGWIVYNVYADTKTGTTLDREKLNELIKDGEDSKFNIIAVTKLDRISRSIKDFLDLDGRLDSLGVDIVVTTQNIDTTTPAGKMQRNIMLAFAEFERDMIADRTREKLYSQAQKGFWGGGMVLLGYDVVDKKLIVNTEEAKLVERIFRYYLQEPSTNKIANRLNDEGFKTKQRKSKSGKVSGSGSFTNQHVLKILNSQVYVGRITYKGETFQGIHSPIVDPKIFEQVQEEIQKARRYTKDTYEVSDLMLLGLTKCGYCGNYLTSTYGTGRQGERYHYYKCTNKTKHGSNKCEMSDIPAEKLEKFIEDIVVHIGMDNQFFDAVFEQMSANENVEYRQGKETLTELKKNKGEIEKKIKKTTDYISQAPADVPLHSVNESLKDLENQKLVVAEKIVRLERDLEIIETYDISKDRLQNRYSELASIYSTLSRENKRNLTRSVLTNIECFLKKKETKGKLRMAFRGDGIVETDFFKTQKAETNVSTFCLPWLRG